MQMAVFLVLELVSPFGLQGLYDRLAILGARYESPFFNCTDCSIVEHVMPARFCHINLKCLPLFADRYSKRDGSFQTKPSGNCRILGLWIGCSIFCIYRGLCWGGTISRRCALQVVLFPRGRLSRLGSRSIFQRSGSLIFQGWAGWGWCCFRRTCWRRLCRRLGGWSRRRLGRRPRRWLWCWFQGRDWKCNIRLLDGHRVWFCLWFCRWRWGRWRGSG